MAKKRSTSSLKRSGGNRQPRKIILIVVEGKETECNYFNQLKKHLKLTGVSVEVKPSKSSAPFNVVDYAHQLYKQREKESKKGRTLKYEQVFCVVDCDHPDVNNYRSARNKAKQYGFYFIYSNPCFEIWFLLHFNYSTRIYSNCQQVINDLKQYIIEYKKAINVFELIFSELNNAIQNAKKLETYHQKNGNNDELNKNPSTKVYVLVEQPIGAEEF